MKKTELFNLLMKNYILDNDTTKSKEIINKLILVEIRNKKTNDLTDLIYVEKIKPEIKLEFGKTLKNIQKENDFFYHKLEVKDFEYKKLMVVLKNNYYDIGFEFFENIFYKLENIKHIFEIKLIKKNG